MVTVKDFWESMVGTFLACSFCAIWVIFLLFLGGKLKVDDANNLQKIALTYSSIVDTTTLTREERDGRVSLFNFLGVQAQKIVPDSNQIGPPEQLWVLKQTLPEPVRLDRVDALEQLFTMNLKAKNIGPGQFSAFERMETEPATDSSNILSGYFALQKSGLEVNSDQFSEASNVFRKAPQLQLSAVQLLRGYIHIFGSEKKSKFAKLDLLKRQIAYKYVVGWVASNAVPTEQHFRLIDCLSWSIGIVAYLLITLISFLRFIFIANDKWYGERREWYRVEWGKLLTWIHVLIWAPWVAGTFLYFGIKWAFTTDFAELRRKLRQRQVRLEGSIEEIQQHFQPTPAAEPEGVVQPTPVPEVTQIEESLQTEKISTVDGNGATKPVVRESLYFVTNFNDDAESRLNEAGIRVKRTQLTINDDEETTDGILFPTRDWQQVFRILGIKPVQMQRSKTNVANVTYLEFVNPSGFMAEVRRDLETHFQQYQKLFTIECVRSYSERIRVSRNAITAAREGISQAMATISSLTRSLQLEEPQLKFLEDQAALDGNNFQLMFQQLTEMEHVVGVKVERGGIHVFTDALSINYEGKSYLMGEYEITINTDNCNLTWTNLFRQRDGIDHPYADCMGNVAKGVAKLLGERNYAHAVQVILKLLQTVHEDYENSLKKWEGDNEEMEVVTL